MFIIGIYGGPSPISIAVSYVYTQFLIASPTEVISKVVY
jgi:hypothetical protein